jgi:transposase
MLRKTGYAKVVAAPPPHFDEVASKGRNVVERAINRLKDIRAVATRY